MLSSFGGIFGLARGERPPTVLALHGWARSHSDFDAVLAPPGKEAIDSIALDLPGFGATAPPANPWGSADYASAIVPLVAEMAANARSKVVVVGHSLGGRIGVHLAAAAPEHVGALVLVSAPVMPPRSQATRSPLAFRIARSAHRRGLLGEASMERYRQRYGSADYRRATGVMRQVLVRLVNERYEDVLARVSCPVELVWGEGDSEVPVDIAERVAALLPGASVSVWPGVGHLLPTEAPGVLTGILERLSP